MPPPDNPDRRVTCQMAKRRGPRVVTLVVRAHCSRCAWRALCAFWETVDTPSICYAAWIYFRHRHALADNFTYEVTHRVVRVPDVIAPDSWIDLNNRTLFRFVIRKA